jgi:hypothetical protein
MLIKMSQDKGRFLQAKASDFEQLGDREDMVEDAAAVLNQPLHQGRTPAGAAAHSLDWSLLKELGSGPLASA